MFLLAGTLATGFVSCSSDDDEVINTTILTPEQQNALSQAESESRANANKTEMGRVVANYINEVVKPTYLDLAEKSNILYKACQNLYQKRKAGTLTQNDIDAACEASKEHVEIGSRVRLSSMVLLLIMRLTHISTHGHLTMIS